MSSETGVVQLAKNSKILQSLKAKGKLSGRRLSCLNEIIPVLSFADGEIREDDEYDDLSAFSSDGCGNNSINDGEYGMNSFNSLFY